MAAKRPVRFGVGFGREAANVSVFDIILAAKAKVSVFEEGLGYEAATVSIFDVFLPRNGQGQPRCPFLRRVWVAKRPRCPFLTCFCRETAKDRQGVHFLQTFDSRTGQVSVFEMLLATR